MRLTGIVFVILASFFAHLTVNAAEVNPLKLDNKFRTLEVLSVNDGSRLK